MEVTSQFPNELSDYAPAIHAMTGLLFLSVGEPVYSIAHLQLALEVNNYQSEIPFCMSDQAIISMLLDTIIR